MKEATKRLLGAGVALFSVYLGLSLATYSRWDPSLFTYTTEPVKNLGGTPGSYLSDALISTLGLSAWIVPVLLLVYGIKGLFVSRRRRINLVGAFLFFISMPTLAALFEYSFGLSASMGGGGGGFLGKALLNPSVALATEPGAYVIALVLMLSSLVLLSPDFLLRFLLEGTDVGQGRKGAYEADEEEYRAPGKSPKRSAPRKKKGRLLRRKAGKEEKAKDDLDVLLPPTGSGKYVLPGIGLLNLHDSHGRRPTREETKAGASVLERRLKDFGVQGDVTDMHVGPVVTMYEYEPAPGVKINRVVTLSDDLALALKVRGVRIAPLAGKAALGIEVPNENRETVSLRQIISSETYRKSTSKLSIVLGKDIFGTTIVEDLRNMPHLLVAGATGAGKSVHMNAMVQSILYKASPQEVKMLLIDPKVLELSYYEGIPHLISPVITNPKEATRALKKITVEMDKRYRMLADKGTRNIEGYNAAVPEEERMPYIVVFIDELADLMLTSGNDVEDSIARLAQMARASGIHLVMATQRPSVDVITGAIKANFPARISFQVSSKIDSRTILDAQGAENLIGKGDMLFMVPGKGTLRVHGALVTEGEVRAVTTFIRAQGLPDYAMFENIDAEADKLKEESAAAEDRDDHYYRAVDFAESTGEVSISSIQRRLKIGYNKAARIMETMDEDGLVGPKKSAGKPRDFLRRPSSDSR